MGGGDGLLGGEALRKSTVSTNPTLFRLALPLVPRLIREGGRIFLLDDWLLVGTVASVAAAVAAAAAAAVDGGGGGGMGAFGGGFGRGGEGF